EMPSTPPIRKPIFRARSIARNKGDNVAISANPKLQRAISAMPARRPAAKVRQGEATLAAAQSEQRANERPQSHVLAHRSVLSSRTKVAKEQAAASSVLQRCVIPKMPTKTATR